MKLTNRIHLVGSGAQGFGLSNDYDCHVYLIDGGHELALIDAGGGLDVKSILENVRADGFDPDRIRHLLLTHAHGDHAGGAAALKSALGELKISIHADCAAFLRDGDEEALSLSEAKRVGIYPSDYCFHAAAVDTEIQEGDEILVGDLSLRVIESPGHSRGHICFAMTHDAKNILFGGDLVFFGGKILLQNTWDCDLNAHLKSLEKMRDAAVDMLFPGHLAFSLRDGQRHIDAALKFADGLLVPPNFTYGW